MVNLRKRPAKADNSRTLVKKMVQRPRKPNRPPARSTSASSIESNLSDASVFSESNVKTSTPKASPHYPPRFSSSRINPVESDVEDNGQNRHDGRIVGHDSGNGSSIHTPPISSSPTVSKKRQRKQSKPKKKKSNAETEIFVLQRSTSFLIPKLAFQRYVQ